MNKISRLLEQYHDSTGEGVSVAVIDSGIEADHPDLRASVEGIVVQDRIGEIQIKPYDGADVAGHGTACAGRILSIAPNVQLVSCRVLNNSIAATSEAMIAGLEWVLQSNRIHVVNMSLGTSNPHYGLRIIELVDQLYARGIPVIASRGYATQPDYPAAFGSAISVGSAPIGDGDIIFNRGEIVEFSARGENVEVLWRKGGRVVISGSSFAAPLVAGRVARFKALDPRLRVWEIKSLLQYQAEEKRVRPEGGGA